MTIKKLITILKKENLTIASAESLTGGYLSYLLTKIPGSSKVFKGGVVIYSLEAKNKFFKIPLAELQEAQGVSANICKNLAIRVKKLFNSKIGVALVGFAGPKAKLGVKVGTVFMAISNKDKTIVAKWVLKGTRNQIQQQASQRIIKVLYEILDRK